MLSLSATEIEQRARALIEQASPTNQLKLTLEPGESAIGGGAAPTSHLPTMLIALTDPQLSAAEIEQQLRNSSPAVIARISEAKVLLDLRTIFPEDLPSLVAVLKRLETGPNCP
jgi:L-seryl-tRNA(Ser) seleniumtransferase